MSQPLYIYPDDPAYPQARQNVNESLDFKPAVLAICYDCEAVQAAVGLAKEKDWQLAVRSSGHSYEGFSLIDGGMVIDVSPLNEIVPLEGRRIRLGPATQLIDVYTFAAKYANGVIPGGTCATVCVGGLALGGGFGYFSRKYGMACDWLRRVQLVKWDGTIIDSDTDPELLWACQGGGGGNFGAITAMEFELADIPEQTSLFKLTWKNGPEIKDALRGWQQWALEDIDRSMYSVFMGNARNSAEFTIDGQFLGSEDEMRTVVDKLIERTPPRLPADDYYATMPMVAAVRYNDSEPAHPSFKNTSGFNAEVLCEAALNEIDAWLCRAPTDGHSIVQVETFGGAINDLAPTDTAFPHRNFEFSYQFQTYWDTAAPSPPHEEWLDHFSKTLRDQYLADAAYRNYGDLCLANWQYKYYGDNYPRLQSVKARYDPEQRFVYPQVIELPCDAQTL